MKKAPITKQAAVLSSRTNFGYILKKPGILAEIHLAACNSGLNKISAAEIDTEITVWRQEEKQRLD
jgi:hypothetical protein